MRRLVMSVWLVIALVALTGSVRGQVRGVPDHVLAARERNQARVMDMRGVIGIAAGKDAVVVLVEDGAAAGKVPAKLDGVPVRKLVTGKIFALATSRYTRPVPIGVSIGNEGLVSAGTLGCRVKDADGAVYMLSNNHVLALENSAPIGSKILQPGRYDGGSVTQDVIGNLHAFIPINFDGTTANTIDAATASTTRALTGAGTLPDGYGYPSSTIKNATVGMAVQKYGRTTDLTRANVTAINATVRVSYSAGTALFTGQLIIEGKAGILKPGDSGSLAVTDDAARNPVGLMYAGDTPGKLAIANEIDDVLAAFNVTIDDGKPAAEAGTDRVGYQSHVCQLDGSASVDVQTYAWTQLSGKTVTLADADTANPSFTVPSIATQTEGRMTFRLTVTNAAGSDTDEVQVTVRLLGDANGDGRVDSADRRIWLLNYDPLGSDPSNTFEMGDFNMDGFIDSADRRIWLLNYNPLGLPE